jgi:twitching motility protein PilT
VPVPGGGRVVATELLFATPAVRNLIREAKVSQMVSIMQTGSAAGMHTMDQDLARLVRDGIIPYEIAKARCHDPKDLERLVFEVSF